MRVKSAALLIANATRRLFGDVTSRMSPPSATLTGPIANVLRSRPPLTGLIRNGSAKPGTFTIPPPSHPRLRLDGTRDTRPANPKPVFPVNPGGVPSMVRSRRRDETFRGNSILDPPRRFLPPPSSSRRRSNVRLHSRSGAGYRHVPSSPIDESARHVLAPKISSLLDRLPCQYRFSLCHQAQTLRGIRNPVRVGAARRPPATLRSSAE